MYKNSPISPDNKWPPTPSRKFINLVVVEGGLRCRDDYIGHTLLGNNMKVLEKRKEISTEQILEAEKGQGKLRLILIEGAPGIGKSTLAWELCRKWEELSCIQQYRLVILLRLREEEVQKITNVSDLFFFSYERESLAKEVLESQGSGILFILDGFDELPKQLQRNSFLLNLINGRVLPESTVLVTSRPSATGELLTSCRPQIQKHVEVLGFTQQSVEAYASSIFSSEPEKLGQFRTYISASNNPAINSLMYVPLNAAIVVEIFRDCKSDKLLPHTLTELYTQLCLTILNRYLKIHCPSVTAEKFGDLPPNLYQQFLHLSEMAFTGVMNEEVILYAIPPNLTHFDFLDATPSLYGGGGVSYNFLHLTVQEFFAAYYISHLGSSGLEVLQKHGKNPQWNTVWRFVAGLTKFKEYVGHIDKSIFIQEGEFSLFLFQCLFEAQTMEHFSTTLMSSSTTATVKVQFLTSLDAYVLGFCIANFPVGDRSWNVALVGDAGNQLQTHSCFTCGLETNKSSPSVIEKFRLINCPLRFADLSSNPMYYLVTDLRLVCCQLTNADMICLSELIPHLTRLKILNLSGNCVTDGHQHGLLKVLHQLRDSNVISLNIRKTGLNELLGTPYDYTSAIRCLIDASSGKLERLAIGEESEVSNSCMLLSAPSSLKQLYLYFSSLSPHVAHLKNDTQLRTLILHHATDMCSQVPELVEIVSHNGTLEKLVLFLFVLTGDSSIDAVGTLVTALQENKTLHKVSLYTVSLCGTNMVTYHEKVELADSRITLGVLYIRSVNEVHPEDAPTFVSDMYLQLEKLLDTQELAD